MNKEYRDRIIQGIVLINLSIFLLSSFYLTSRGSFSWETGNNMDYFFSWLSARNGWGSCLMILLCSSICSLGIYRIFVKPISPKADKAQKKKDFTAPYFPKSEE
jgi:hypothetical protein